MKLYHGSSNQNKPSVIVGYDKSISENIFDGIFLSYSYSAASSHGEFVHTYDIEGDQIASSYNLEQEWSKVVEVVAKEIDSDDEDIIADIAQLVIDDEATFYEVEEILEYLCCEQEAACGLWELQRIRGRVAAAIGFSAVEMNDEHGTSYLLVK